MNVQTKKRNKTCLYNVSIHYPKCWTVLVNLQCGPEFAMHETIGEIYAHTDTEEEAQEIRLSLGKTMGTIAIVKGDFSDNPIEIGGLWTYDSLEEAAEGR
ncbi:MAG: hypothetical protein FWG65_09630 [Turicibacter sp.]|nr:hypothetical protein [Turicibacter sp.]